MKTDAYHSAIRLLTRREHGAYELAQKLAQKGYSLAAINEAIAECQRLDLQSDSRFAASLCRARIRQGYGPLRIRQELQNLRIEREIVEGLLRAEEEQWVVYAKDVRNKKYKENNKLSYIDQQKQKQFLSYRGFAADTINRIFES